MAPTAPTSVLEGTARSASAMAPVTTDALGLVRAPARTIPVMAFGPHLSAVPIVRRTTTVAHAQTDVIQRLSTASKSSVAVMAAAVTVSLETDHASANGRFASTVPESVPNVSQDSSLRSACLADTTVPVPLTPSPHARAMVPVPMVPPALDSVIAMRAMEALFANGFVLPSMEHCVGEAPVPPTDVPAQPIGSEMQLVLAPAAPMIISVPIAVLNAHLVRTEPAATMVLQVTDGAYVGMASGAHSVTSNALDSTEPTSAEVTAHAALLMGAAAVSTTVSVGFGLGRCVLSVIPDTYPKVAASDVRLMAPMSPAAAVRPASMAPVASVALRQETQWTCSVVLRVNSPEPVAAFLSAA